MDTTQELWQGYQPDVKTQAGNPEVFKYTRLWETAEYRAVSPGEHYAQVFLQQAKPRAGSKVIESVPNVTGRVEFVSRQYVLA